MITGTRGLVVAVLFAAAVAVPARTFASDHADPVVLNEPESNITDLFFFPKDDRLVVVLDVRRQLTMKPPYNVDPFEYAIHMDLKRRVAFDDESLRARYGGHVVSPGQIEENVTIAFHLDRDPNNKPKSVTFKGLTNEGDIHVFTGAREDPFIFPRFFTFNVISMVASIPKNSFPEGAQDFIVWATVFKGSKQIDHVGRSSRSQQARFDGLNTIPPSQHVDSLMKRMAVWNSIYTPLNSHKETKPLADLVQLVLQQRKYDLEPDVLIYSTRFPVGFPNGRLLTDDVAGQTCAAGDCILQELAFIEGPWPRSTVNDKNDGKFLDDFPYLLPPNDANFNPVRTLKSLASPLMMAFVVLVIVEGGLLFLRARLRKRATVG